MSKELNTFHDDGDLLNRLKVAFEVTSADDVMEVTDIDLRSMYKELNRKLFQNALPEVPLKWIKSVKVGGKVRYRVKNPKSRNPEILRDTVKMDMSMMFKRNIDDFKAVFIHEMIHVYEIFGTDRTDFEIVQDNADNGHGEAWKRKRDELERITGLRIPMTEEGVKEISDNVKIKEKTVLLGEYGSEGYKMIIVSNAYFSKNKAKVMGWLSKNLENGATRALALTSDSKELLQYQTNRKIETGNYKIKKELGDLLIKSSNKILEDLTSLDDIDITEGDWVGAVLGKDTQGNFGVSVFPESTTKKRMDDIITFLGLLERVSSKEYTLFLSNHIGLSKFKQQTRIGKNMRSMDTYRIDKEIAKEILRDPNTTIFYQTEN